jgi:hypothetical protein
MDYESPPLSRNLVETLIEYRSSGSKHFRRVMRGIGLVAGLWAASQTNVDFSSALVRPGEAAPVQEAETSSGELLIPFGVMVLAGTAAGVEKTRRNKYIERLIDQYAGQAKAGYTRTVVGIDESHDLVEGREVDTEALMVGGDAKLGSVSALLTTISTGVVTYGAAELYELAATVRPYKEPLVHALLLGSITLGLSSAILLPNNDDNAYQAALMRLDNIDGGLRFETE